MRIIRNITIAVMCLLLCGCLVYADNDSRDKKKTVEEVSIEYTTVKNDRIQILSTATIAVSRKATTTYWIMCVDGYRYLVASQSSGVAVSQMFYDKDTPLMCTKQDKD